MKVRLAAAFAVVLFATLARADSINTPTGTLIIPDGSTVTAFGLLPTTPLLEEIYGDQYFVDYNFADGTGFTEGNFLANYAGTIDFSTPVTDLTYSWVCGTICSDIFAASNSSGVTTVEGPISQITWYGGDLEAGITSMSYAVDAADPSSLLLSGMGLIALIGLRRRISCRS
jgi:hypothetical protein